MNDPPACNAVCVAMRAGNELLPQFELPSSFIPHAFPETLDWVEVHKEMRAIEWKLARIKRDFAKSFNPTLSLALTLPPSVHEQVKEQD